MPDAPLDSWDMLFKPEIVPKFKDCGIYVLDDAEDVTQIGAASISASSRIRRTRPTSQKAGDLLKSIRPYIQKFNSSEYINALANGDICLAIGYYGDILQARDRAEEAKAGVNDRLHRSRSRGR